MLELEIPYYRRQYMTYMPHRTPNTFYLASITADDILLEIKRLKQNKSPGHDLFGSKVKKKYVLKYFIQICQNIQLGDRKRYIA